ncbi:TetR/AcrR family transcriptional regulator [Bacillus safensis]|uniref:TetR/AcrR family transcriptional regulator n=1 Tax=Bacillus TaxID=1386 RepID=UPI000B2D0E83|nr:TetR/AcrR family transcriptional regulator [Bacillus safensis]MCY7524635.1 TetR/AcrR family transcriptional regulator [Bacillus safensis]MDF1457937.1 TetR/AcrR family transcriptional regulator [Bacillus safensis]MEC0985324.1 TetR/AcrR family transcriptional regulator [Bacillus safensis]MEC1119153.1 TetR/AcrR family transcriptional regulator [Bacillus safensis]MED0802076.1 TetR/AcrR family transcriptional regulator [Bacillus safensis]
MIMPKKDPRTLRTRQLIVDSFLSLASEKDFNNITVRDITEKATINRATFYAHFDDKFDLLHSTITNTFTDKLKKRLNDHDGFNEKVIANIFLAMCDHHKELSELCPKGYHSLGTIIESKIKEELQKLIADLVLKGTENTIELEDKQLVTTLSTMLSWGIYGAAYTWNKDGRPISPEDLVTKTLPIFKNGMSKYFL